MSAVRTALAYHPEVLAIWRINSGAHVVPGERRRFIKYHDIDGCSDLIGILRGGRWLAVECKRPSTRHKTTKEQKAFLQLIRDAGGIAFVAASADEALEKLIDALMHGKLIGRGENQAEVFG